MLKKLKGPQNGPFFIELGAWLATNILAKPINLNTYLVFPFYFF